MIDNFHGFFSVGIRGQFDFYSDLHVNELSMV